MEARWAGLQYQEDEKAKEEIAETLVRWAYQKLEGGDWQGVSMASQLCCYRERAVRQHAKLQEEMDHIDVIPAMLVTVAQPPSRKKARIVACGNHL